MGALRSSDGAFALGEMASHTSNAGRIYFPSGTPDPGDVRDGMLDIPGSVMREVEEETGLTPAEYRTGGHWDCIDTGTSIAMIRILQVDMPGEALRAKIEANLARQTVARIMCNPSRAQAKRHIRCDAALRHGFSGNVAGRT